MTMASVTDFHSHILPGMDDGSASVEESIAMLEELAKQGIRRVAATPHFYADRESPAEFLARRDRAEALLRQEMAKYTGLPRVTVGAEVYFFRGMSQSETLRQLTIRGKNGILIEMPPAPWTDDVLRELEAVWELQGIVPIIAHIDRYISPLRTYGLPGKLAKMPVMVQANASFFLRPATAAMAIGMLRMDQIQLLGSDCHNMTSRRPNLGPAQERIVAKLGPRALGRVRRYEHQLSGGAPVKARME